MLINSHKELYVFQWTTLFFNIKYIINKWVRLIEHSRERVVFSKSNYITYINTCMFIWVLLKRMRTHDMLTLEQTYIIWLINQFSSNQV